MLSVYRSHVDERECSKCGRRLPNEMFHQRPSGKFYYHCKDCQRAYVRQHYQDNREVYLARSASRNRRIKAELRVEIGAYLRSHPCVDCGEADPIVLQFDHVRGTKVLEISNMVKQRMSWKRIQEEIAKCDVRCAHCHIRKTAADGNWWLLAL